MGLPTARMSDTWLGTTMLYASTVGPMPATGVINAGAPTVLAEGLPAARMSDAVLSGTCGSPGVVNSGSPTVLAEGLPVAKLGDPILGAMISGVITSAAPTVLTA